MRTRERVRVHVSAHARVTNSCLTGQTQKRNLRRRRKLALQVSPCHELVFSRTIASRKLAPQVAPSNE